MGTCIEIGQNHVRCALVGGCHPGKHCPADDLKNFEPSLTGLLNNPHAYDLRKLAARESPRVGDKGDWQWFGRKGDWEHRAHLLHCKSLDDSRRQVSRVRLNFGIRNSELQK